MLSNYYTLRFLAADLHSRLRNSPIEDAFTQNKNELLVSFRVQDDVQTLVISCEPSMNYLFLRNGIHRAKKNSVDVFRTLPGKLVRSVAIHPSDRELVMHLSDETRLLIRLYGSKANVLLVDEKNVIVDSFLNARYLR